MAVPDSITLNHLGDEDFLNAVTTALEDQWFCRLTGRTTGEGLAKFLIAFANAEGGTTADGQATAAAP